MTRPMILRVLACIASIGLLSGCLNAPVTAPTQYLLRAQEPLSIDVAGPPIWLAELRIAPYLRNHGIAVATGENQISYARAHVWAEPLTHASRHTLAGYLQESLARPIALGPQPRTSAGTLRIAIDQMHGGEDGRFVLVAHFDFAAALETAEGGVTESTNKIVLKSQQSAPGYQALVAHHQLQLQALAAEIAKALNEPSVTE